MFVCFSEGGGELCFDEDHAIEYLKLTRKIGCRYIYHIDDIIHMNLTIKPEEAKQKTAHLRTRFLEENTVCKTVDWNTC